MNDVQEQLNTLSQIKHSVFGMASAKTAAVDASQLAPAPGPGADAAMAAGPPMMDPNQAAAMGMAPPADPAAGGAPPADPAAAGGAPPMDPAAAAAGGAPPMDPAAMGPPPKIEDLAAQGDPIATFLMEMMSKISNIEVALRGILKSSGAMVSADAILDDKKPNIVIPKAEGAAGGSGGSSDSPKKTAGVAGTTLTQAAGTAGVDMDDMFDDTDSTIVDNTPDDDAVSDAPTVTTVADPLLPKAAKAPQSTVTPLGARASTPGANGATPHPTGLTSVQPRSAGVLRMLRTRREERSMASGKYTNQNSRMRP